MGLSVGVDIGRKNLAIAVWEHGSDEVVCYRPELAGCGSTFIRNVLDFLSTTIPTADVVAIEDQRDSAMAKIAGAIFGFYYPKVTTKVFMRAPARCPGATTYRARKRASTAILVDRFGTIPAIKMDDVADSVLMLDREVKVTANLLSVVTGGGAPVRALK